MNSAYSQATAVPFPSEARIESLFAQQAARTPDEVALVFRDAQWTYRQLDSRSDALAAKLQACGVRPGELVAICLERSLALPAAMLAVLKAGGTYIPLDPAYPAERLRFMLDDARPVAVIASRETEPRCPPFDGRLLLLDQLPDGPAPKTASAGTSTAPAYVIFTSGSTGTPKGVVVTHRNVANFFTAMDAVIGGGPGVWLAVTSIGFDISVLELLWTLTRGFRVVIQEEGQLASSTASMYSLPAQIKRHGVTHLQCTPSLAAMLVRDPQSMAALRGLRRLLVGGEALPGDLAQRLRAGISGELFNLYGPTETTVWSASHRVAAEDERVPIGRPIANTNVYVLDDERRPVPLGTPGELYIGGEGVAAGYLNRPELTAERFVTNPFSGDSADRIYRTGDVVRYDALGRLEFLGRVDQQVKIRGARVELGEIEVVLRRHPAIRDAVAIVREQRSGDKRLIAYTVSNPTETIAAGDLRAWLATQLPEVMVPSAIVFVEAFPMTPNGKIDRRALPEPPAPVAAAGVPAATETERRIAQIWADVLGAETVGVTDRFFDVGGHSLLMVDVQGQLEDALGCEVPLVDLFRFPTIRSFAAHLDERDGSDAELATAGGSSRGRLRQQSAGRRVAMRAPESPEQPPSAAPSVLT